MDNYSLSIPVTTNIQKIFVFLKVIRLFMCIRILNSNSGFVKTDFFLVIRFYFRGGSERVQRGFREGSERSDPLNPLPTPSEGSPDLLYTRS
jgi:hypothetical protein